MTSSLPFWNARRLDAADRSERRRLNLLQPRVGLVGVGDLLKDRAVIAKDHVFVSRLWAAEHGLWRAEHRAVNVVAELAFAIDQIAAGVERIGIQRRHRFDGLIAGRIALVERRRRAGVDRRDVQGASEDIDIDARVAINVIVAAEAEDRVVARAAREMVARLAADDQVVSAATVGGKAYGGEIAASRIANDVCKQSAGIDDVVAGEVERISHRENPLVVLVF